MYSLDGSKNCNTRDSKNTCQNRQQEEPWLRRRIAATLLLGAMRRRSNEQQASWLLVLFGHAKDRLVAFAWLDNESKEDKGIEVPV